MSTAVKPAAAELMAQLEKYSGGGTVNVSDVKHIRGIASDVTLESPLGAFAGGFSEVLKKCDVLLAKHKAGANFDDSDEPQQSAASQFHLRGERDNAAGASAFGWPGAGNGRSVLGSLKAALSRATDHQREQVSALVGYLREGIHASADLTPSGDGGVLIPTFVQDVIERNYAQFAPVVSVARIFGTDTGADQVFPVLSDSESGEQVAAAAATGADATVSGDTPPTDLTGPTLKAYKISSKPIFVSRETFTDSNVVIVSELLGALLARIIRMENLRYTKGTGSGQAEGFLMSCSLYEGHDTLDLDVALDLAYSVPALYRPNGVYMMSDTTAKYLRKLKTGISGDKRQLWADADATKNTPATLHGYPVIVNNDMSDVAADGTYHGGTSSPVVFGDFSKFVVRQAEQNRPFTYRYLVPARDGVGLILFRRSDSKLIVPEAIAALNPSGS